MPLPQSSLNPMCTYPDVLLYILLFPRLQSGKCNEIELRRVILIKESQNFLKSEIWNAGRGDRDRRAPSAVASSSFGDFKSFFNRTDLDHFFVSKRLRFARDSDRSRPVWVETALDQIERPIQ